MRELPLEWTEGKWAYTQVSREGDVAIYQQKHREGPAERFELVVVQHRKERVMPNGGIIEAGEYYPSSSQWGQAGWTHFTLAEAQAQAVTLGQEHDERPDEDAC